MSSTRVVLLKGPAELSVKCNTNGDIYYVLSLLIELC